MDNESQPTLASRLGLSAHTSPLRMRLISLAKRYPSTDTKCLEDWLLDVANRRGARIVVRDHSADHVFTPPPEEELSNEELVVAICQLQGADRPQLLRLAAQLISRKALDITQLKRIATRERVGSVLKTMARSALTVEPEHPHWKMLAVAFSEAPEPHDVVIHWSRLAEPVMKNGRCNASAWRLVA